MTDISTTLADGGAALVLRRDRPEVEQAAASRTVAPRSRPLGEEMEACSLFIEEVVSVSSLERHRAQWEQLAKEALEPNPALEPFYHLSGLTAFGGDAAAIRTALVWRIDPRSGGSGQRHLVGLFAYQIPRGVQRLLTGPAGVWAHSYSFLGTPLLCPKQPHQVLAAFLDWFGRERSPVFMFRMVPAEGAFASVLRQVLHRGARRHAAFNRTQRAVLNVPTQVDDYLKTSVSGHTYRKLCRKRERLSEAGDLEFKCWRPGDDFRAPLEQFFALEKGGWKGQNGTAIACADDTRQFVAEAAAEMAAGGQLGLWSMTLDGNPVAMSFGYLAHGQAWLFKSAYDESYSKLSPGTLTVIELMREAAKDPALARIDACADAGHPVFDYLWRERLAIHDVLVDCHKRGNSFMFDGRCALEHHRRAGLDLAKRVWHAARGKWNRSRNALAGLNPARATSGG